MHNRGAVARKHRGRGTFCILAHLALNAKVLPDDVGDCRHDSEDDQSQDAEYHDDRGSSEASGRRMFRETFMMGSGW